MRSLKIREQVRRFADAQLRHRTQGTPQPEVIDGIGWEDMDADERAFVAMHVPGVEVYVYVDEEAERVKKSLPTAFKRRRFIEGRAVVVGAQMPGFVEITYRRGVSGFKETVAAERLRPLPHTRIAVAVACRARR